MTPNKRLKNIIKLDHATSDEKKIYKVVLDFFDGDTAKADEFMTSSDGGYTNGQLNTIKYEIQYKKTRYLQSLAL
jgi:RNA binding exosome subunit